MVDAPQASAVRTIFFVIPDIGAVSNCVLSEKRLAWSWCTRTGGLRKGVQRLKLSLKS